VTLFPHRGEPVAEHVAVRSGWRPFAHGILLWLVVSVLSLWAVEAPRVNGFAGRQKCLPRRGANDPECRSGFRPL